MKRERSNKSKGAALTMAPRLSQVSTETLGNALYCAYGPMCRNPVDQLRPTKLRSRLHPISVRRGEICSHCAKAHGLDAGTRHLIELDEGSLKSRDALPSPLAFNLQKTDNSDLDLSALSSIPKTVAYGYDVNGRLAAAMANESLDRSFKLRILDYVGAMNGTPGGAIGINLPISVMASLGRQRLSELWKRHFSGVAGLSPKVAALAAEASSSSSLLFSDQCQAMLSNEGADKDFQIYANPLFCAILSDKSLAEAIAHEYFHHLNRHYRLMDELSEDRVRTAPKGSLSMSRLREAANIAVDCVTNAALGLTRVELAATYQQDSSSNGASPERINRPWELQEGAAARETRATSSSVRDLFLAAVVGGDSLRHGADGTLYMPLVGISKELEASVRRSRTAALGGHPGATGGTGHNSQPSRQVTDMNKMDVSITEIFDLLTKAEK